ncbi:MAG: Bro-N domain-containing protein [Desulfobacteraceae bacterium]|nr:Bro-N domain-containing protein [Desulfobacteraceae bacterium]
MKDQTVLFQTDDQEFPMEIVDHKGERWVSRKQLAEALGVDNIRTLHSRLFERGELKENIHFSEFRNDSLRNPKGGNPNIIIYSYRGIIRMGMASEGKRAVAFRDWAEDVLYDAMVREISGIPEATPGDTSLDTAFRQIIREEVEAALRKTGAEKMSPPDHTPALIPYIYPGRKSVLLADDALALKNAKENRLHIQEGFKTFEEYARKKFGISRSHAYRLINYAKLIEALAPAEDRIRSSEGGIVLPLEKYGRYLGEKYGKDTGKQAETWIETVSRSRKTGETVTLKLLKSVAERKSA